MKRIILGIIVALSVLSMSGCTVWTHTDGESSFFDNTLNESVIFEENVDGFDQIQLNVDLSVSSVTVESIKGDTIFFEQKANRKELLAELNTNEKGKTLELHFKNDQKLKITTGTQKSEVIIRVPEGIELVYSSDVGVGDTKLVLDDLSAISLDVKINVGEIVVSSNEDQKSLEKIELSTDVGDTTMDLDGDYDALKEVHAQSNTGSIELNFEGNYAEAMRVFGQSDVGEVQVDFSGTYDQDVDCAVNSSVGDINVKVPKNHEIFLDAKTTEFTSDLELVGIQYSYAKDKYTVSGDKSKFSIDLSITIGDAVVEYSN